ncbi:MAG TPA: hypothetical protein VKV29_01575 [Chthonomonas sp.]|jgi:hypothetical protein|uniref:ankyrin repeat domain-containing protein n=1 Tax=Chthonomonas sp. TaxID=2282153 RepID=UPI002B4B3D3C|nr:hypothetical protein [Chthonomonas sp.]HLH78952.1 hypothetical protein [Chthonomonas sp.]
MGNFRVQRKPSYLLLILAGFSILSSVTIAKEWVRDKANTTLIQGVRQNQIGLVVKALRAGADPNCKDPYTGETPRSSWHIVQKMQKFLYGHPLYQDSWPVLLEAAFKGEDQIMEALLKGGAKVNIVVADNTPLGEACFRGDVVGTQLLLQHGANPNMEKGYPPLIEAALGVARPSKVAPASNYAVILQNLLDYGADPNCHDSRGASPLWVLLSWPRRTPSYLRCLQLLLRHSANVEERNSEGDTPLLDNLKNQLDPQVIVILLEAGANIYAKDRDGYSALYWLEHLSETPAPEAAKKEVRAIFHQWLRTSRGGVKTPFDRNLQKTTGKEPYNKR